MAECVLFADASTALTFVRAAGPYRVATALRAAGFEVRVVEFFATLSDAELAAVVDRFVGPETLMLGFSSSFYQRPVPRARYRHGNNDEERFSAGFPRSRESMEALVARARARAPRLRVVFGGTKAWREDSSLVDWWVTGFADRAVVELARALREGGEAGLRSEPARSGRRIDANRDYPFDGFARSRIEFEPEDAVLRGETLPVEIARGCVFRCSFCHYPLNGKDDGANEKDPGVLREELLRDHERHGTTSYLVGDDLLNDSPRKLARLREAVAGLPFRPELTAFLRLDLFKANPAARDLLAESGLRACYFGLETFHPEAGRAAGKGLPAAELKRLLAWLRDGWGDEVTMEGGFIIGLPGEPFSSSRETAAWLMGPDNPLDGWKHYPLYLAPDAGGRNPYASPLELDPGRHGFRFGPDGEWTSPWGSYREAADLAEELMTVSASRRRVSGFNYPRLRNLGYSHAEAAGMTWAGLESRRAEAAARRESLRTRYFDALFARARA